MSDAVETLKPQLAALSPDERETLIEYLIALNDGPVSGSETSDDFDPEYRAELDRRLEDMRTGKDPGVPAEEVFRRLREKYG